MGLQLSGGVSRLGVQWECAGQWWYIKARELGGSVQVSGGVSRLGSCVGVCSLVVVCQG